MKERIDQAIAYLSMAQGILDEIAKELPEDQGGQIVALPSPRDIIADAGDMIDEIIENLNVY